MKLWISAIISCYTSFSSAHFIPSASVHPEKAITYADLENGIQLSTESYKTMEIATQIHPVCDEQSIVFVGSDKYLYRSRQGWLKRIKLLPHAPCKVNPEDQLSQDLWVSKGASFVRTAEIEAFVPGDKK